MGRKLALVIGNSQYDDPGLARLPTCQVDVRELAEALQSQQIGQFDEVTQLADQGLAMVRRSIAHFYSQAKKDDLVVLYFSGHGVKDEQGHLYLAVKDTERPLLAGTSIESSFVVAQMDRCYSKRQVLILDCCHSGAFAYGAKAASAEAVGTGPAFEGRGYGRIILTATDSTQYAWQGDQIIGESDNSVFTHYLLQGLRTGEADRDGDGLITIDELYAYVHERVVSETPKQTPGKWSYKQQGDIVVALNPNPVVRPVELPLEVRALVESPLPRLRAEAVPELENLLKSQHRGLVLAARQALGQLLTDDSRRVAAAAEAVLSTLSPSQQSAPESTRGAGVPTEVREPQAGPDSEERALQERLDRERAEAAENARAELEREQAEKAEQRRREQIATAADLIGRCLTNQELDRAQQELEQAETAFPDEPGFPELRARLSELRQQQEHERQAHDLAQRARRMFEAGDHEAALDALRTFSPAHDFVSETIKALEQDLERLRKQEARRREEAERRARQEQVARHLESARAAIREGKFALALEVLASAQQLDPQFDGLAQLFRQAEAGKAATEEAEHVRLKVEQLLTDASGRLKQQDFQGSLAQIDAALRLDRGSSGALTLRKQVEAAIEDARHRELERQAEAAERAREQKVATARGEIADVLELGDLDAAERALAQAETEYGDVAPFEELRKRLLKARDDRLASEAVDRARRDFAAGHHEVAVATLERFRPAHPVVTRALADLRSEIERLRQQEERRQAEVEKERKRAEAKRLREEEDARRAEAKRVRQEEDERRAEAKRFRAEEERRWAKAIAGASAEPASAVTDSTVSEEPQGESFLGSAWAFLQRSRPLQLGLLAGLLVVTLILYRTRSVPVPEAPVEVPVASVAPVAPVTAPLTNVPPVSTPPATPAEPVVQPPPARGEPAPVSRGQGTISPPQRGSGRAAPGAAAARPSIGQTAPTQPPVAPPPAPAASDRIEGEVTPATKQQPTGPPAAAPPTVEIVEKVIPPAPAPAREAVPSAAARDEATIRNLLQEFEAAYERKDVNGLSAIWPSQRGRFSSEIALLNSVDLSISGVRVDMNGDTATVTCRMDWRYNWRRAGLSPTSSQPKVVLSWRRAGASWVIVTP